MAPSLAVLLNLANLALALLVAFSSAAPISSPDRDEVPKRRLLAHITGDHVRVHEDRNLTVKSQDNNKVARFYYNQNGDYIIFQSVDFNRSFLHFVEVVSSSNDSLEFSGYNETMFNATDYNSTEEYNVSSGVNDTATVPVLKLVLGELEGEVDGTVRHHMWVEESLGGNVYTYSIRPNNQTVCYLAFEADGTPVSDPCDDALARDTKARFFLLRAF